MAIDGEVVRCRQRRVEGAAVEDAEAPVGPVVKIEIEEVEVREGRNGVERGDEAAVAKHVAHVDDRARDQEVVRSNAGVDFDVIDEKFESARFLDLLGIDSYLDRRLEKGTRRGLQRRRGKRRLFGGVQRLVGRR